MSDTPTPPEDAPRRASGETPISSSRAPQAQAPRRKRPWTILGRLSQAVREQNWFAVGLEVLIVVLGVVIGFQVTGWGQARADAAKERAYLHQLVDDLQETENNLDIVLRDWFRQGASTGKLVRPYRSSSTPPADSVLVWMNTLNGIRLPTVTTGTATALVETGDLNLIQNDSLRSSITRYLGFIDRRTENIVNNAERLRDYLTTLSERVDLAEAYLVSRTALATSDSLGMMPGAPNRAFEPLDVEAFYQDRVVYTALVNYMGRMSAFRRSGRRTLAQTAALREQVEAELNR